MALSEVEPSSSSSSRVNTNCSTGSAQKNCGEAFYLAKTVLRGSVVRQAVRGHLRSSSSCDIVFGKETSIELVTIDEDGIVQSISEQPVFGTIKDLAILPWTKRFLTRSSMSVQKDLLLVISDSGKLSFLAFCNEVHRFLPLTHIQLSAPGNPRNHTGRMLAVDSTGCFVSVSAYEDQLALFSLSMSLNEDIIDKRILCPPEEDGRLKSAAGTTNISGTIWSMCFISEDSNQASKNRKPILAILLNRRGSFRNELLLLQWDIEEQDVYVLYQFMEAGPLAHHVVEVPNSQGFAFLFRAGDIALMDFRNIHSPSCVYRASLSFNAVEDEAFEHVGLPDVMDEEGIYSVAASALLELSEVNKSDDPMNIDDYNNVKPGANYVCSWCWEPDHTNVPRIVFSADSGDIYVIEVLFDPDGVKVNLSECLFKGQPSSVMIWLDGDFLAAIVDMADGMVLKFEGGLLQYQSPIQNTAPILDMCAVDYSDEKHDKMFACSGMASEGSLRIIRSGISVEKLLKTAPIYHGVTGTWSVKMKIADTYHSFLVLSFVEETRVLSVGVSFSDVTDLVGYRPDVCTLACGLVADGVMVQIHQYGVRLCSPIKDVHPEGIPLPSPMCTSWSPDNMTISLGAVGDGTIVVATSSPCLLFILGIRSLFPFHYEVYQMQSVKLQDELSCISLPQKHIEQSRLLMEYTSNNHVAGLPPGDHVDYMFVIGTHKPSIEVLSFTRDKGLQLLATGKISLVNNEGTAIGGCVPQDVRLVLVDRLYVLSGLRNGMLVRFEWPAATVPSRVVSPLQKIVGSCTLNSCALLKATSLDHALPPVRTTDASGITKELPVNLQLIAVRRIGIAPVFLVSLSSSLDADMIALSDRPWLLHTARHSLSYTSISFQPSTHVTPICSIEIPRGILFVAENSLHLVETVPSKRLNVQKLHLDGTPRKILCHNENRLLLVLRTELDDESCSSDVCCVDPLSGSILTSYKFEPGETGKCMEFLKNGNDLFLVIGTSLYSGPAMMPSGEAESTKGRVVVLCLEHAQNSDSGSVTLSSRIDSSSQRNDIGCHAVEQYCTTNSFCSDDDSSDGIKFDESEGWTLRLAYSTVWPGVVLALSPYFSHYFLASSGQSFFVCDFNASGRVRRLNGAKTRFTVVTLTAHLTRIAVGDCRDGILFYTYNEDTRKLEQLYCDPVQRLVADCVLMDDDTAIVSDRKGSISVLSSASHLEGSESPERNLTQSCSYYMGEIAVSIRKGSFSYKLPGDDMLEECDASGNNNFSHNCIMASTLLGNIIIFIPMTKDEYKLLEDVQAKLVVHPLTAPILGNNHNEYRSRESLAGIPRILDGDILSQFLELTSIEQEAVMAPNKLRLNSKPVMVNQVVQLLERVHYVLS